MLLELSQQDVENIQTALMTMAKQPDVGVNVMRLLMDLHEKVGSAQIPDPATSGCCGGNKSVAHSDPVVNPEFLPSEFVNVDPR